MATALRFARLARRTPLFCSLRITPAVIPAPTLLATRFATSAVSVNNGGGSGGKHWKYERVATVALMGLIPAGFIYPCTVVDYGLAVLLPLHGHWGFESIIEDYSSPVMRKLAYPLLYLVSIGTFLSLAYLNYYDIGICKAVKTLWALK